MLVSSIAKVKARKSNIIRFIGINFLISPIYNFTFHKHIQTITIYYLIQSKYPCPEGKVMVQWLCHLIGFIILQGRVVHTTFEQGVINEPN
jgi:hypothetical protein